jgi:putative drug exporter of the RND superfamily
MLARLARVCFRRRRVVLAVWIVALVVLSGVGQKLASYRTEFSIPASDAKQGLDLLKSGFSGSESGGADANIVFRYDKGIDDPAVQAAMTKVFAAAAAGLPGMKVVSPYDPIGKPQVAAVGEQAGKLAYGRVVFPANSAQGEFAAARKAVEPAVDAAKVLVPGLQIELGGEPYADFKPPSSETLGLAFAIFILLAAFGSVLAMGLPIGIALFGVGTGIGVIGVMSSAMQIPEFSTTLGAMIGLGVGIDYALFIVTRYREELHVGRSPEDATVRALDTAGRAVLFAGITVVISLLGMMIMGLKFVQGLAVGASVTVLLTMIASITLLPALLGFAGKRVEVTKYRGLLGVTMLAIALLCIGLKQTAIGGVIALLAILVLLLGGFIPALNRVRPAKPPKPIRETGWYKWSRFVEHRPWPIFIAGAAVLLLLASPVLSLRLGNSDTGNYPKDTSTRKAYDLLSEGFGPGSNGPLALVASLPAGAKPEAIEAVTKAVAADPNVAFVSPGQPNPDKSVVQWFVLPKSAPQDKATGDLVHRLRDTVIPAATNGTDLKVLVTGNAAVGVDFADFLARRLIYFIGVVLILSFLLLMAVFRSVLVPLKAVIMNLLSIGAAYGIAVMVFQWGWLADLIKIGRPGPIEPWAPMMLFAITFGLSMDYEVFLLSRMREEYDRTGDSRTAVADGLASTARVITAAAAIMVFVFGSFLLEANRQIKLFGLGLSVAVLLDATIVRMLLVPATMELLGDKNWWMPKWLDRIVPKLNVEGHAVHVPDDASSLVDEVRSAR